LREFLNLISENPISATCRIRYLDKTDEQQIVEGCCSWD